MSIIVFIGLAGYFFDELLDVIEYETSIKSSYSQFLAEHQVDEMKINL